MVRRLRVAAALSALVATLLLAGVVGASPALAYAPPPGCCSGSGGVYDVVGTGGGVYWRYAPYWNSTERIPGYGAYDGYAVVLDCWAFGDPVGPYGNTLWYFVETWYPSNYAGDGSGWISDHFLDTPGTAANPQPLGSRCPGY